MLLLLNQINVKQFNKESHRNVYEILNYNKNYFNNQKSFNSSIPLYFNTFNDIDLLKSEMINTERIISIGLAKINSQWHFNDYRNKLVNLIKDYPNCDLTMMLNKVLKLLYVSISYKYDLSYKDDKLKYKILSHDPNLLEYYFDINSKLINIYFEKRSMKKSI